jgi:predicted nucleic acid-binding protein
MILCDTSFLIGYFSYHDVHHSRALDLTKGIDWDKVVVTKTIFEELMTVLTVKYSLELALEAGKIIMDPKQAFKFLRIDEGFFEDVWQEFKSRGPHRFSFVDMSLITLAKTMDAKVLSFDEKLNTAILEA